jgi:tetratricopeptide (TPR) repeat protein
MKVFLSHSTKDQQFVQTFAAELKAEKIEPWICEVDVEFGGNFVAKIEEGLRDADLTILFWSPEAARSDWTRLEWTSVTAREISESPSQALILQAWGRLEEAETAYREAIQLNPQDAVAHTNLGLLLKEQGRAEEAEAAYCEAIRLNPQDAVAHTNLGLPLRIPLKNPTIC